MTTAYKCVSGDYKSPSAREYRPLEYAIGADVTDPFGVYAYALLESAEKRVHWCYPHCEVRILILDYDEADLVHGPLGNRGTVLLRRCKVVGEIPVESLAVRQAAPSRLERFMEKQQARWAAERAARHP